MNILCRLFGHKYPPEPEHGYYLSEGEYPCNRCKQSIFGKDPYKVFGGKERFIAYNAKRNK
jgi:hypothetical protein